MYDFLYRNIISIYARTAFRIKDMSKSVESCQQDDDQSCADWFLFIASILLFVVLMLNSNISYVRGFLLYGKICVIFLFLKNFVKIFICDNNLKELIINFFSDVLITCIVPIPFVVVYYIINL